MKTWGTFLMATGLLLSSAAQAATQTTVITQGNPVVLPGNSSSTHGTVSTTQGSTNTEVVVPVPPQVIWGNGNGGNVQREAQVNCMSCCIYQNRNYSEGSVVRAEGVLLQCQRDKGNLGTNNLVWRIIKEQQ
ncbi:DUF1496 domain-containing protein [Dickeya fangzhongdai]|uniref:DUF1496 domain-containing protein n=1 Tax=Dickeya fangzhongdai TaxID=1778540 RepID=UPI0004F80811|nr:DUF1496 domain-containing protein [Dickeya fangzhongdai]AIR68019.1 hypothetical protein LH89_01900 [Dickeya fangzhongdai]KGT99300.1 hypothetical protein NM75_05145 [Dickeya fangzhongdai]KHN55460.1 hypothetical protein OI70_13600 [Dickeya fangzhongdai]